MGTPDNDQIISVVKAAIENATVTINVCKTIIQSLSPELKPQLVGIREAARMMGRSESWLRQMTKKGNLTSYQIKKGGHYKFDPVVLVKEIKELTGLSAYHSSPEPPTRKIRRRKRAL